MKRLHLDEILFEDNKDHMSTKKKQKQGGLKAAYDEEGDVKYIVLTEDARKIKVSTQSTQTIKAFYQKYHAVPSDQGDVATVNMDLNAQSSQFIAECFE